MCGIFAAINIKGTFNSSEHEKFKKLTELVKYRGPDASGYYFYNSFTSSEDKNSFNIFLGHNRLSIIDLSDNAHQPMKMAGCVLIFNGEIFNYIELRAELIKKGVVFKTESDTEVVIKLYREYGESAFNKLNGMWAFILYDNQKNRVIISRDRFSEKPIYYYRNDSTHYFASELKQILPLQTTVEFNTSNLSLFLKQGLSDIDEQTFIKDIIKIKPKTNLVIDLEKQVVEEAVYWDYDLPYSINWEEASQEFMSILHDSIKIRLRSDVEVGALVSGGLDSSALSVIAQNYSDKIRTFSVISDDKRESEENFIDLLIKETHLVNEKLLIRNKDILDSLDEVLFHQDEPFNNLIVLAHYQILKKIKRESNITVVLSGQGGDESLLGYLRHYFFYLKDLLRTKSYLGLSGEIFNSILNRTVMMQFRMNKAKRYMPSILKNDKSFLLGGIDLQKTWGHKNLREAQIQDIDKYSVPYIARYEDRNSMAHSLEIRLPFLDYRLINLLVNIPAEFKINKGWNKYILRKNLTTLPDGIRWRRDKKGFSLPEDEWLKKDLYSSILDNFQKSILAEAGLINRDEFIKYYKSYVNGNHKIHNTDITRVFLAEKWAKNLIKV